MVALPARKGVVVVRDLGVVTALDLMNNGPQVLESPAIGDFVALTVGINDFVSVDGNQTITAGPLDIYFAAPIIDWGPLVVSPTSGAAYGGSGVFDSFGITISERNIGAISSTGADWVAALHLFWTDVHLSAGVQSWSANHSFASGVVVKVNTRLFSSSGGVSGGSPPSWPTVPGITVSDGTITWTCEGVAPTQGALHLYSLTATPA